MRISHITYLALLMLTQIACPKIPGLSDGNGNGGGGPIGLCEASDCHGPTSFVEAEIQSIESVLIPPSEPSGGGIAYTSGGSAQTSDPSRPSQPPATLPEKNDLVTVTGKGFLIVAAYSGGGTISNGGSATSSSGSTVGTSTTNGVTADRIGDPMPPAFPTLTVRFHLHGNENCVQQATLAQSEKLSLNIAGTPETELVYSSDGNQQVTFLAITKCEIGSKPQPQKVSVDFGIVNDASTVQDPTALPDCPPNAACAQPAPTFSAVITGLPLYSIMQPQSLAYMPSVTQTVSFSLSEDTSGINAKCYKTALDAKAKGLGLHIEADLVSREVAATNSTSGSGTASGSTTGSKSSTGSSSGSTASIPSSEYVYYRLENLSVCEESQNPPPPPAGTPLKNGIWASEQSQLDVGAQGASLVLGCASSQLNGPILLDSSGNFTTNGTYQTGGGAMPIGGFPTYKAVFKGHVEGNVLTLNVTYGGDASNSQQNFTLTLTYGFESHIAYCL